MTKRLNWKSVRDDVSRHYNQGMSLREVRDLMEQKKGFKASIRAYRFKISEWEIKRSDITKPNEKPGRHEHSLSQAAPIHANLTTNRGPYAANSVDTAELDHNPHNKKGQHAEFERSSSSIVRPQLQDAQDRSPQADKYDEIIRQIHEAPSSDTHIERLYKNSLEFYGYSILHHVAARGLITNLLEQILLFCTNHGHIYYIDALDEDDSTPLHVAIRHGRTDNAIALLNSGAGLFIHDIRGELPLHMAIISGNSRLVQELLTFAPSAAKLPVKPPSKKPGRVALDLAVDLLLTDIAHSGEAVCTQAIKRIFLEITTTTSTIEDTTFLIQHAHSNWTLFRQAATAIDALPYCKELKQTMKSIYEDPRFWFQAINYEIRGYNG